MRWNWINIVALLSGGYFFIILIINEFRYELFNIRPGYAPHNFGFNFTFFLPSTFLVLIGAFLVLFNLDKSSNRRERNIRLILI